MQIPTYEVAPDNLEALKNNPDLKVYTNPGSRT